jgi:hypothetical protein
LNEVVALHRATATQQTEFEISLGLSTTMQIALHRATSASVIMDNFIEQVSYMSSQRSDRQQVQPQAFQPQACSATGMACTYCLWLHLLPVAAPVACGCTC